MATPYSQLVGLLTTKLWFADSQISDAIFAFDAAQTYYLALNDHAAIGQIIQGCYSLVNSIKYPMGYWGGGHEPYLLTDILQLNFAYTYDEFPEVTYQSIVEAWIADDFEGRAITIAMIDRMRQIIWNEPYFVQWAARPEDEIL